ncbi:hypothetical protein [Thalassotalea piscium]|uniref:Outer membrane protein beta-barrel domain-containing protein n=1 Tax=Thalassotalea piscium TaxID=1230533 RepID=A0A7X0NFN0_9GAMM|nr:hypothetical protein [Thalassotalea piscium]MBB6542591.1 hypothetical protein [Thalassotalea piscium]
MLNKLLLITLLYLPLTAAGAEYEFSLGAGFQYSGIVGTQFAVKHKESKYFISVGLPGYSVGMQTTVLDDQRHSVGFSIGELQGIFDGDSRYGVFTYNYHFDGFKNTGWLLGAGIGIYDQESYKPLFNDEPVNPSSKAMFTLDIGYKF